MLNQETLVKCLNKKGINFVEGLSEASEKGFLDHSIEYVSKLGNKVKYTFSEFTPNSISSKIINKEGSKELEKHLIYNKGFLFVDQSKKSGIIPHLDFRTITAHYPRQIKPYSVARNSQSNKTAVALSATYSKSNNFKQDALTNMVSALIRL